MSCLIDLSSDNEDNEDNEDNDNDNIEQLIDSSDEYYASDNSDSTQYTCLTSAQDSTPELVCDHCSVNHISIENMTSKEYYFDSYARISVHEEMLKDEVMTLTYRSAILNNKHLFRDKIVLDIGCGTGILSMFAVDSGAQHVIGIECSGIAEKAQRIIADNGFDGKITIIKGLVEEVELPNGIEKVDIIISEWMGYCLFYDSMLDAVITARDKWLKPNGLIFPDSATLYVNGFEDIKYKDDKINWWYDVHGFNMSCVRDVAINKAYIHQIGAKQLVTNSCPIKTVDLYTAMAGEATFCEDFVLLGKRNDYVHGFATYFTVQFTKCHTYTGFSTSAESHRTHFNQTVFYMDDIDVIVREGGKISGCFQMVQSHYNKKHLYVKIHANVEDYDKHFSKTIQNYFKML